MPLTALNGMDRWVRHAGKRPITIYGSPASSTNHHTWATYQAARRSAKGDGLGFVLGAGIACIDIDHCLVGGKPDARAIVILERFPTAYAEVSPSGTGLHVWGRAPEQPGRRQDGYEVYSVGRYMTVTGEVYRFGGLPDITEAFH